MHYYEILVAEGNVELNECRSITILHLNLWSCKGPFLEILGGGG